MIYNTGGAVVRRDHMVVFRFSKVLVENVLSTDLMCSQLVTDAWCFLVR
jgi:hypothetical protein